MLRQTTFTERINERVCAIEDFLKRLEPMDELLERLAVLENNIYTAKKVLTFEEACLYLGISASLLYKLTSAREVPHYKPRGKMLYFNKGELDHWLLQNNMPTISAIEQAAKEEKESSKPYFGQKRYKKRAV